jgi:hypothetical protein
MWIFSVFQQFTAGEKSSPCSCEPNSAAWVNHPQFDLPGQTIGSPSAGVTTAAVGTPRYCDSATGRSILTDRCPSAGRSPKNTLGL